MAFQQREPACLGYAAGSKKKPGSGLQVEQSRAVHRVPRRAPSRAPRRHHGQQHEPQRLRVGLHRPAAHAAAQGDARQVPGHQGPDAAGPAPQVGRAGAGAGAAAGLLAGAGAGLALAALLGLHLRRLREPLADAGHPRHLAQHRLRHGSCRPQPLVRHLRQPAHRRALLRLLQEVPRGPPPLPGWRRAGCGRAHAPGGPVLLHAGPQAALAGAAALFLLAAAALREPQGHDAHGGVQRPGAAGGGRCHPPPLGGEAHGLPAGQHPPGPGPAPHLGPLCRRALHVPQGPRDLLLLRAPQLRHLQRGLPRGAPRLPQHPRLLPAPGAEDRARVLRPPAAAPLVGEGALGLCVRGLPGALRQGEAGVQAGRGPCLRVSVLSGRPGLHRPRCTAGATHAPPPQAQCSLGCIWPPQSPRSSHRWPHPVAREAQLLVDSLGTFLGLARYGLDPRPELPALCPSLHGADFSGVPCPKLNPAFVFTVHGCASEAGDLACARVPREAGPRCQQRTRPGCGSGLVSPKSYPSPLAPRERAVEAWAVTPQVLPQWAAPSGPWQPKPLHALLGGLGALVPPCSG